MPDIKDFENLLERAEKQRDDADADLAMTMSELEDLLGTGSDGSVVAMAFQGLKPSEVSHVIHAVLVGNPDYYAEVIMGAGRFAQDVAKILRDEGRGYKAASRFFKRHADELALILGETMSKKGEEYLDKYDEIINDYDDEGEDEDC